MQHVEPRLVAPREEGEVLLPQAEVVAFTGAYSAVRASKLWRAIWPRAINRLELRAWRQRALGR